MIKEASDTLLNYAAYLAEIGLTTRTLTEAHRIEKGRQVGALSNKLFAAGHKDASEIADEVRKGLASVNTFDEASDLFRKAGRIMASKLKKPETKPVESDPPKDTAVPAHNVEPETDGSFTTDTTPATTLRQIGHPDNWFNQPVTGLPVHPESAAWMAALEAYMNVTHNYGRDGSGGTYSMPKVDINNGTYTGAPSPDEQTIGHHINRITADNVGEIVWHEPNNYPGTSDWFTDGAPTYAPAGDYLLIPYHPSFRIQGNGLSHDNHLYVVDEVRGYILEWYRVENYGDPANLTCGIATYYPLNSVIPNRGLGCTSSNAAGTPYIPGIVTPDDFVQGSIDHVVLLTLPNQPIEPLKFLEPAQHTPIQSAASWPDPPGRTGKFLPYGPRLRLRGDFDVEAITGPFAEGAKIILRALQTYGFFHVDGTVGNAQIVCANDEDYDAKWHQLASVHPSMIWQYNLDQAISWSDFEVIDATEHTFGQEEAVCTRSFVDERGQTAPNATYP